MKRYLKFFIAGCWLLWLGSINAQDLDKDMKFFYTGFAMQPSLECHMISKVYKTDQSLYFNKEIKLIIHNNQYYYDMGDKLYVSNKKYLIWIDKADKRMVVGKTDVGEVVKFKKQLSAQLDTMHFKTVGEIIYKGVTNGLKLYQVINMKDQIIAQANIEFDANTNYLKKMEFIFKNDQGSGMASSSTEFKKIDLHPNISESMFDESPYIIVKEGKITTTPAYKNYDLVIIDQSILDQIKN